MNVSFENDLHKTIIHNKRAELAHSRMVYSSSALPVYTHLNHLYFTHPPTFPRNQFFMHWKYTSLLLPRAEIKAFLQPSSISAFLSTTSILRLTKA